MSFHVTPTVQSAVFAAINAHARNGLLPLALTKTVLTNAYTILCQRNSEKLLMHMREVILSLKFKPDQHMLAARAHDVFFSKALVNQHAIVGLEATSILENAHNVHVIATAPRFDATSVTQGFFRKADDSFVYVPFGGDTPPLTAVIDVVADQEIKINVIDQPRSLRDIVRPLEENQRTNWANRVVRKPKLWVTSKLQEYNETYTNIDTVMPPKFYHFFMTKLAQHEQTRKDTREVLVAAVLQEKMTDVIAAINTQRISIELIKRYVDCIDADVSAPRSVLESLIEGYTGPDCSRFGDVVMRADLPAHFCEFYQRCDKGNVLEYISVHPHVVSEAALLTRTITSTNEQGTTHIHEKMPMPSITREVTASTEVCEYVAREVHTGLTMDNLAVMGLLEEIRQLKEGQQQILAFMARSAGMPDVQPVPVPAPVPQVTVIAGGPPTMWAHEETHNADGSGSLRTMSAVYGPRCIGGEWHVDETRMDTFSFPPLEGPVIASIQPLEVLMYAYECNPSAEAAAELRGCLREIYNTPFMKSAVALRGKCELEDGMPYVYAFKLGGVYVGEETGGHNNRAGMSMNNRMYPLQRLIGHAVRSPDSVVRLLVPCTNAPELERALFGWVDLHANGRFNSWYTLDADRGTCLADYVERTATDIDDALFERMRAKRARGTNTYPM